MPELDQETYLKQTSFKEILIRGLKKVTTEITSIKTMFLAFLCVAMAFKWISDIAGIVGGLATLGVKEIPGEVFTAIIQKITPGGGGK